MIDNIDCTDCDVKSLTCFNTLEAKWVKYLDEHKSTFIYKKGQTIFYEGGKPPGIFCLKSGKIKIYKMGIDGKEQIVRFITPGDLLGIRALVGGREYSAYAETIEDSTICLVNRLTFVKLIEENPEFSHCVMKLLSRLLEEAENKMTSLAQKPVRERLAETLISMSNLFQSDPVSQNGSTISLPRNDLANIVGTATETVIRLLSEFKEDELISINGRNITLLNVEGLKRTGKIT